MDNITSLRLRYFPFTGRAQPIRDALHIADIAFEDERLTFEQFQACRSADEFPFGALPVLHITTSDGEQCVAQSNAILRFVGRLAGLYPSGDPLQALKVDEVLDLGEDINALIVPSLHEQDASTKMAMRKQLAEEALPYTLACLERLLVANGSTGFMVGSDLSIADLKLYWIIDWLTSGILDGIPTNLIDEFDNVVNWRKNIAALREARLEKANGS